MVMIQDEAFDLKAREEYLEDIEIEERRAEKKHQRDMALVKAEQGTVNKYRTIENVLVKLMLIIPYCFAIVGVVVLGLAGKNSQKLEDFLS